MGGAKKALLDVGGETILERQLTLLRSLADPVALVAGDAATYSAYGAPVISDRRGGLGPLDGIAAALSWSPRPYVLIVACDMPWLSGAVLCRLLERRAGHDAIALSVDGRPEPLVAVYRVTALPAIDARLERGELRARALWTDPGELCLGLLDAEEIRDLDPALRTLANWNAPEDIH